MLNRSMVTRYRSRVYIINELYPGRPHLFTLWVFMRFCWWKSLCWMYFQLGNTSAETQNVDTNFWGWSFQKNRWWEITRMINILVALQLSSSLPFLKYKPLLDLSLTHNFMAKNLFQNFVFVYKVFLHLYTKYFSENTNCIFRIENTI